MKRDTNKKGDRGRNGDRDRKGIKAEKKKHSIQWDKHRDRQREIKI